MSIRISAGERRRYRRDRAVAVLVASVRMPAGRYGSAKHVVPMPTAASRSLYRLRGLNSGPLSGALHRWTRARRPAAARSCHESCAGRRSIAGGLVRNEWRAMRNLVARCSTSVCRLRIPLADDAVGSSAMARRRAPADRSTPAGVRNDGHSAAGSGQRDVLLPACLRRRAVPDRGRHRAQRSRSGLLE